MKKALAIIAIVIAPIIIAAGIPGAAQQTNPAAGTQPAPPLWAFPVAPAAPRGAGGGAAAPAAAPDTGPKSVPGSSVTFTQAQVRDSYNVPDWHPDGHP